MVLVWGCVDHGRANLPVVNKKIAIESKKGQENNSNCVGGREEPIGSGYVARGITARALGAACQRGVSLRTGGAGATGVNRSD